MQWRPKFENIRPSCTGDGSVFHRSPALPLLPGMWSCGGWRWGNNNVPALHSGLHSSVPAIGHHLFGCRCQLRAFVCLLNFITGIYQQYHIFIAPPPYQIDRELQQLLTFFGCKIRIVARNNNF